MKIKLKSNTSQRSPFTPVATALAHYVREANKQHPDNFGDALTQALKEASNICLVALDNGVPIFLIAGKTVNFYIPLDSEEAMAIFAKAARGAGVTGLTKRDFVNAIEVVKFEAIMEGNEAKVSIFNEYQNEDFSAEGVVINTNSPDGTALSITNGNIEQTSTHTGIAFKWDSRNAGVTYTDKYSPHQTLTKLRELFSNLSYEKFMLSMAYAGFILTHPRSNGLTFPILYLYGEAGTGKTTIARLLTKLLGLAEGSVKTQPKEDKDLVASAANNYLLCFDNCGSISNKLSNLFCSVATGGVVEDRKLFSNSEVIEIRLHQPMILTAIEFAKQYDLTTRSIFLKADKPAISYASDTEIFRKLDSFLPEAQSWLLDTCAKAMNETGLIEPILDHRAGDFCHWLAAFELAVGIEDQSLQHHVQDAQNVAIKQQATDHDDVLATIIEVVNERGIFEGTPTQVYKALTAFAEMIGRLPKQWPGNASAMSNKLNRISEQLEKQGVEVISGGARGITGRNLILQPICEKNLSNEEPETIPTVTKLPTVDENKSLPDTTAFELQEDIEPELFDDDLEDEISQEEANRLTEEMLG